MNELLDDDIIPSKSVDTFYLIKRSGFYILIILIGSFVCSSLDSIHTSFSNIFGGMLAILIMSLGFTILVAIIRGIGSLLIPKKYKAKKENPLWYRFIEETFASWIFVMVINFLRMSL